MTLTTALRRVAPSAARLSSRAASSLAYTLEGRGEISSVIARQNVPVPETAVGRDMIVRWLAAGIDPVDIAAARGAPSAASLVPQSESKVAGTEGVALVQSTGPEVKSVKTGDLVIPIKTGLGTWRETGVVSESEVIAVPNSSRLELAATLSASPFTAYRLLADFADLSPGDVVVQNAGSSAVGTAIVQLANTAGLHTISLVSESMTDYAPTVERLKLMGGDVVIGESHVDSEGFKQVLMDLPAPKLGINGADDSTGSSCQLVAKLVRSGSPVVTYCPGTENSAAMEANRVKGKQFSLAEWLNGASRGDVEKMVARLNDLVECEQLTGWLQRVKFADLPHVIEKGGVIRRKLVAVMPEGELLMGKS